MNLPINATEVGIAMRVAITTIAMTTQAMMAGLMARNQVANEIPMVRKPSTSGGILVNGNTIAQVQAMAGKPDLTASKSPNGNPTAVNKEHHMTARNCPVHVSTCDINTCEA